MTQLDEMAWKASKLSEAQKAFIVKLLACFDSPTKAAEALRDELGVKVMRQAVERYDPRGKAGATLAKHFVELFEATRRDFPERLEVIGMRRAVRLRRPDRMSVAAEDLGNFALAAALIEQATKECGNFYTSKRELRGKNGGPVRHSEVEDMTDEELDRELRRLLGREAAPEAEPH